MNVHDLIFVLLEKKCIFFFFLLVMLKLLFGINMATSPVFSLEALPLQYVYAMLFALEEINHSTTLLPGVRLGFHLHDSCALPLWALHAVLSLVGGNSSTCNPEYSYEDGEENSKCLNTRAPCITPKTINFFKPS